MKIQELFDRLTESEIFKNFKKENAPAFLCAGFFILNFKTGKHELSIDYRDDNAIYAFKIPENESEEITMFPDKILENQPLPPEVAESTMLGIKLDVDELEDFVNLKLKENNIKNPLEESIAVLQVQNGKFIWNLTCICSSFVIVSILIDPLNKQVIKFEKKNLMDFVSMKKVDKK